MVVAVIVLLTALSISGIAAYYSIVGLMEIFSGAATTIAIMGSALELGKLVTASWLYHFWGRAPVLLRTYLTLAVIVLMFITSMGIFGYLSKAHLAQVGPADEAQARIEKIDFDIAQQEKRIERSNHILKRFDEALEGYYKMQYITRALREREKQKEEREALQVVIREANAEIDKLVAKRFELKKQVRGIEAEVGPIKYISAMIYGDQAKDFLDESVRAIIVILIFVFDPLAVILVIAGNMSIKMAREKRVERKTRSSIAPAEEKPSDRPEKAAAQKPKEETSEHIMTGSEPPLSEGETKPPEDPFDRDDDPVTSDSGPPEAPVDRDDEDVEEALDSLIDEEQEDKEKLASELLEHFKTSAEEKPAAKRKTLKLVKPLDIDEDQGEQLMKRVEEAASGPGDYSLESILSELADEMGDDKTVDAGATGGSGARKIPVKK